jgi:hypothetical protein
LRHPANRAERRFAYGTWRNHRRKRYITTRTVDPAFTLNSSWMGCGKQNEAHGNRCFNLCGGMDHRLAVKRERASLKHTSRLKELFD